MEQLTSFVAGSDKSLAETVIAELQERGFCKLEITVKVARDSQVSSGLDSFCGVSPEREALASFILDEELLARVIHACHCCQTLKDVHDRVLFLLKQSPVWDRKIMTSTTFFEALIPHLVNLPRRPTARQIYQAVYYVS